MLAANSANSSARPSTTEHCRWRSRRARKSSHSKTKSSKRSIASSKEASLTDSLTGFWNRRFLLQQIPKELAQVDRQLKREADGDTTEKKSLLFLMFDLDGFKDLNDTYGHAAGDRVLIQVRKMLLDVCRQSDTIIRWGGDEFLLVGRNADPRTAEALAERIRASMEEKAIRRRGSSKQFT